MSEDPITRLNAALEGRYRVERELGEGGMATVYLAEDLRHERKVALKVLKPELAAVVGAERFLAEIKTTANLQHPHILPLFDSGQVESFLYYVMPYVEGESLRERLDRDHQLPVDEAVGIATNMAEALDYAHRQGVIHRDIKPANVLMLSGKPVISDFGIALAVGAAGGGRLTETGLSLGTPHYMSPEQATGDQNVGPQTDTYALGCVLYEMLAGEPPYTGPNAQAVLGQIIVGDAVSAKKKRASIPPNVDAAIRKALEKLPADRFTTAQDFSQALSDPGFRHGEEAAVGVAVGRGQWTPLAMALGALALVFALGFGWSLLRPEPPQPVSRQVLEGGAGVTIARHAAIAPDGSSVILPVGNLLALKMRGSTEITPIPGTEGGRSVAYSPDGQWIVYAVGSDLFKRPLVGGSPLRLAEDADPNQAVGLAWLDDGTILYEQFIADPERPRRIVQMPEDGGEPLVVFWPEEEQFGFQWVHGLPDGQGALVTACPGSANCLPTVSDLYLVSLRDLSSELILEQVARAWYARTGQLVYLQSDGAVFAAPFDLGALAITGGAIPLFDGVRVGGANADMQLAADGTLLYVEGPGGGGGAERLLVVDLEGNEQALPLDPRPIARVSWSPDGQSVAYSRNVPPGISHDLYTYNVTLGTTPRQITFEGANQWGVFSPDVTRLAFSSARDGTDGYDLFVKNLNDDTPARSIITLEAHQEPTQWSSDTLIVFESGGSPANRDLWTLNLSDPDNPRAEAYLSSEAGLSSIKVSRDGTLAAYHSNESGANEVYIRSFPNPGERTPVSQGVGLRPRWSPDGDTVYYWRPEGQGTFTFMAARIQRQPTPVVISRDSLFTREPIDYDLHPEGDRLIVAQNASTATVPENADSEPDRLILVQNFFEELRQVVPD